MAAPTTTTRSTPVGAKLQDGYQTLIAFAADNDVSFWEKTVTPPGLDGGDPVETTTMHNTTYRTFAPRNLITATDVQTVCAYDPVVYDQIIALINIAGAITVNFPNSDTVDFFGFLRSFTPSEIAEGSQPEATVLIHVTNYDPTNNVEAAPNYKTSSGTD